MVLYFFSQVSELEDGHVKIIEFLANEVSDPLEANDEEETPYHILANAENGLKSIKFLVNLTRSNPIKFDKNHESPLHIAAKFGNLGKAFLWKFRIFLSLRFCVKSILENLKVVRLRFHHFWVSIC